MREKRKDDGHVCTSDSDGGINVFTCNWATIEISRATVNCI